MKVHNSGPSGDRNIKTARQLEQIFELYGMIFKEFKGGKIRNFHRNVSANKRKTLTEY
jgi:hypothetical protein